MRRPGQTGQYPQNMDESSTQSPSATRKTVKFLTATTIGASLLFLSGLTITGTVIALILATPVLVLFSPILVPAGIVLALVTGGFLFSGGCGVAALTAIAWIYRYVSGQHPVGADKLDYLKDKLSEYGRDIKETGKEWGGDIKEAGKEYGRDIKQAGKEHGRDVKETGKEHGQRMAVV